MTSAMSPEELAARYAELADGERAEVTRFLIARADAGGGRNKTHRATGRLLFEDDAATGAGPLHNFRLELWNRNVGRRDDFLGLGETDRDGRFEIRYHPVGVDPIDDPDFELRVFEPQHSYRSDGEIEESYRQVFTIYGEDDVAGKTHDFGTRLVPYWPYDPEAPSPRILVPDETEPPQSYPTGRYSNLRAKMLQIDLVKRKHLSINHSDAAKPTLAEIQEDYPRSLTLDLEEERPGYTRSDAYFGERMLNGMNAALLDKDPRKPGRYWIYHPWNAYEQDGVHCLPDVKTSFELRDGKLLPVEIVLRMRQRGATEPDAPTDPPRIFTPADGEKWKQAKRVARVSAALAAELDTHFTTTHANVEQYAIAAYRNLRKNPLRYLLYPHLKEVILINRRADSLLFGDQGFIAQASGLTGEALTRRLREQLGMLDWKTWRPREALCEGHLYAQAAQLFWQVLSEYVDVFFDRHRDEIVSHWYEVHRFSRDLVTHSVPFFLCGYLRKALLPEDGSETARRPGEGGDGYLGGWFAADERIDLTVPRRPVDGEARAVSPVTETDHPTDEDVDDMKQLCSYVIYHATFYHTWPNSRQHDEMGEILYSSLGLRYGDGGVLAPESDSSIAPSPAIATVTLWFSLLMSRSAYGFIMRNEENDIHPALAEGLRRRRSEFAALGVDIEKIQSRVNI